MKEVDHCPVCFEHTTDRTEQPQCSKHGFPYGLLAEWANEQLQSVEEYYHDQIPVLQVVLGGLSEFATRAEQCGQMNDRLAETIAILTNVKLLRSYHLSILQLLSDGGELIKTGSDWFIRDSTGIARPSPLLEEEEIHPLQKMRYLKGTKITDSGREAFRIYKTAHPLLFD